MRYFPFFGTKSRNLVWILLFQHNLLNSDQPHRKYSGPHGAGGFKSYPWFSLLVASNFPGRSLGCWGDTQVARGGVCVCGGGLGTEQRMGTSPQGRWGQASDPEQLISWLAPQGPPSLRQPLLGWGGEGTAGWRWGQLLPMLQAWPAQCKLHPGESWNEIFFSLREHIPDRPPSKPLTKAGAPGKQCCFLLLQWAPSCHVSSSWTDFSRYRYGLVPRYPEMDLLVLTI